MSRLIKSLLFLDSEIGCSRRRNKTWRENQN
nr:MAG TPA: VPR protein [Caudoviricetes sp.]